VAWLANVIAQAPDGRGEYATLMLWKNRDDLAILAVCAAILAANWRACHEFTGVRGCDR
jgi:hypothetical protein